MVAEEGEDARQRGDDHRRVLLSGIVRSLDQRWQSHLADHLHRQEKMTRGIDERCKAEMNVKRLGRLIDGIDLHAADAVLVREVLCPA